MLRNPRARIVRISISGKRLFFIHTKFSYSGGKALTTTILVVAAESV